MTENASRKQISYIIRLANQVSGRRAAYLSQIRDVIDISSSKAGRGLSKSEASAIIDELKAQLGLE